MMHSGVTIGGTTWQNVIEFNLLGANGQQPKFTHNGDSTWSLTFTPADFYGITAGTVVEAINCVFNAGDWALGEGNAGDWALGEGKDFDPDFNCIDFYLPLSIGTSIETVPAGSFVLFPNPVSEILHIKTDKQAEYVEIYSSVGQRIFVSDLSESQIQLDVSSWQMGIYFISVRFTDGTIKQNKFIKM
jgi:hypothetical protein